MSLVKVKSKFQVTIPTDIREKINLKEGELLEIIATDDQTIILKPQIIIDRDSVKSSIIEGLKDYQEGRTVGSFKSVKEFKAAIKK